MTGIERLRTLAGARDEWILGGTLAEIADQIERELQEERDRWDSELCEAQMDKSRVTVVYLEMNKHVLGHEGMEDSPVARWARELREALGTTVSRQESDAVAVSRDALTDEDRDTLTWVRDHGGIVYVRKEWHSRVPYDRYEARCQRLLGHIAECKTALERRNERIEELGHRVGDLTRENAELRRRAMPEGMEWMLWDDGKPVTYDDAPDDVIGVYLALDGSGYVLMTDLPDQLMSEPSEPVRRPAVLAADGEPLEVGQTVWDENGDELVIVAIEDGGHTVACRYADVGDAIPVHGMWPPSDLTHQRPVLDADGVPIKKGDTVYLLPGEWCDEFPCLGFHGGEELEVFADGEAHHVPGGVQCRETEKSLGLRGVCYPQPSQLTHTKPVIDSWQRIEEDAGCTATKYNERRGTIFTTKQQVARDLVRRCRALAERERGN